VTEREFLLVLLAAGVAVDWRTLVLAHRDTVNGTRRP